MSEYDEFYDDDDQPETSDTQNPVRARMKQLEKENREYKKMLAETEQVKRELAFAKLGVDSNDPKFKYFVKAYDGELSPEAVRQALEEAQLITPQPLVDDSERQGWQQTNKVAAGSEVAPPPPSWVKRIQEANSEQELYAIFDEAHQQGIDLSNL
jgi:hypothetical protein